MRAILLALLTAFVAATSFSQPKMTDREMEGLSGSVRTVREDWKQTLDSEGRDPKKPAFMVSENHFDDKGMILQTVYSEGNKVVFKWIDGFKTFVMVQKPRSTGDQVMTMRADFDETTVEGPDKITAPDPRFDHRYTYEYDKNGRVTSERQFLNTGKLVRLRKFKYRSDGKLSEESEKDSGAFMTYSFSYNSNGLLIETNKTRDILGNGTDSKERIVFTDYKLDANGNWTSRRQHTFYSNEGLPKYNLPPRAYEYTYIQTRTITYF
ncbi:MAG TPA: hypothetical protein PKA82_14175 [Pyrinomonadaceae bacterium]|nr:hypothetical protein [Pyrinomonadaceae bacterium]